MDDAEIRDLSLTDDGRDALAEVAYCFEEVSYGGDFHDDAECRAIAGVHGFEKLGSGVGRDVYAVPDEFVAGDRRCIVKVARNLVGCHETRREADSWHRVSDDAREYLLPVLETELGWVLMPHAETGLATHEIQHLLADFHATGWACNDTNEAHNLGRLDGDPIIIDYGMGCYRLDDEEMVDVGGRVDETSEE